MWGIGKNAGEVLDILGKLGISKERILLCDANRNIGQNILSPEQICVIANKQDYIIIIAPISPKIQDDILAMIHSLHMDEIDCYTLWGLKLGFFYQTNDKVDLGNDMEQHAHLKAKSGQILEWFLSAPAHQDNFIVYQPGKVGSRSVYVNLKNAGKYVLHTHSLKDFKDSAREYCDRMNGCKIISMVRDPIAQMLSGMWQNMLQVWRYSNKVNFMEVQDYYFEKGFELYEFEWFHEELKAVFDIDVYAYPFDREAGYTIIEKSGISVLLMTLEKMDGLEKVIGEFSGIKDFKLVKVNEGDRKAYRFAYSEYKEKLRFTKRLLHKIYWENPYILHFYSPTMIEQFVRKWEDNLNIEIPNDEKSFLIDMRI